MNNTKTTSNQLVPAFFLSELLNARVLAGGKRIGKLEDILIREGEKIPVVTHFYISRSFGRPSLLVPWENVASVSAGEILLNIENEAAYEGVPAEGSILLKDYILDKKVLDTEGQDVDVVYDVKLTTIHNKLYVSDVDLSRYGLLRRIGLKGVANFIYRLAAKISDETISWTYIQPLPTHLGSFQGNVKLNILKEKLSEIHPVDLADIFEEMDHEQRVKIFEELETGHASDVLEEIDPNVQRGLVSALKKDKVAQLIDEMTPGQAADILAILPASEADVILKLLNEEKAKKVEQILEKQDAKVINFATVNFLKFTPDRTAEEARRAYREKVKGMDVTMYLYITDPQELLLGLVDVRELLMAEDKALLQAIMDENVISITQETTLKEAIASFKRYGFRALPITDDDHHLTGVILYRDAMNLSHRVLD